MSNLYGSALPLFLREPMTRTKQINYIQINNKMLTRIHNVTDGEWMFESVNRKKVKMNYSALLQA